MVTQAKSYTRDAAAAIVAFYSSAVLSGIVPDRAHLDEGGYHVSLDDLARYNNLGDYSSSRPLDKSPPVTADGRRNACALDISVSKADMRRIYRNVERVFDNRKNDTRSKYINAINVWSGNDDEAPVRFNFQTGTRTKANKTHTWHGHGDWVRIYVDEVYNRVSARRAARAMVSIWTGQSHDDWLRQENLGPYAPTAPAPTTPTTPEDDDSMITSSHPLPAAYGYDHQGNPLPDATGLLSIGLPPAGHPTHMWGKDYRTPYLSLAYDHITNDTRIRVAIHDGAKWHVKVVPVKAGAGGRVNLTVPPPAAKNSSAYNITIGRVQPKADGDVPAATGSIALMVEMIRK